MKKILFIAAMLLSCSTAFAQTADEVFSDLNKNNGFEVMEVTKDMIAMFGASGDTKVAKAFKDIDNIKLMEFEDEDAAGEMKLKLANLKKGGYEILMDQIEDGASITIYNLKKGNKMKELFMIIKEGKMCKLMLFKGNINPDMLDELISFGGGDDE